MAVRKRTESLSEIPYGLRRRLANASGVLSGRGARRNDDICKPWDLRNRPRGRDYLDVPARKVLLNVLSRVGLHRHFSAASCSFAVLAEVKSRYWYRTFRRPSGYLLAGIERDRFRRD